MCRKTKYSAEIRTGCAVRSLCLQLASSFLCNYKPVAAQNSSGVEKLGYKFLKIVAAMTLAGLPISPACQRARVRKVATVRDVMPAVPMGYVRNSALQGISREAKSGNRPLL